MDTENLRTHGGRKGKYFRWELSNDVLIIENEKGRRHEYHLAEVLAILLWLTNRFGNGWFPLANNVEKLWHEEEIDGLGTAILQQQPRNTLHAQGSSYLGVVLEYAGILAWNGKSRGIKWRIIHPVTTLDELRTVMSRRA
ncbi:MAG: hypothetical protein A4E57_04011 [Syntrophorhabdaceae bacterium PtaU1.Bin034]|jgi:hypothetical protein|nr:MAG: hypothetical protein A4E57_04011 [Syntrophorhabdaceae bacterium PtaU1.Bin034]